MDSDAIQLRQQEATPPPPTTDNKSSINGTNTKEKIDDDDEQAAFLNYCIEKEAIDFEKSAEDKRNTTIDGKFFH